jgi:hypothetical protein
MAANPCTRCTRVAAPMAQRRGPSRSETKDGAGAGAPVRGTAGAVGLRDEGARLGMVRAQPPRCPTHPWPAWPMTPPERGLPPRPLTRRGGRTGPHPGSWIDEDAIPIRSLPLEVPDDRTSGREAGAGGSEPAAADAPAPRARVEGATRSRFPSGAKEALGVRPDRPGLGHWSAGSRAAANRSAATTVPGGLGSRRPGGSPRSCRGGGPPPIEAVRPASGTIALEMILKREEAERSAHLVKPEDT